MDEYTPIIKLEDGSPCPRHSGFLCLLWFDEIPPHLLAGERLDPPTQEKHQRNMETLEKFGGIKEACLIFYILEDGKEIWAKEGLKRLLRELLERGEPIPILLQGWALCEAAGLNQKGRKTMKERNIEIRALFGYLKADGYSAKDATEKIKEIMGELSISIDDEGLRSIFYKKGKTP